MRLNSLLLPHGLGAPRIDELTRLLSQMRRNPVPFDREAELIVRGLGGPDRGPVLEIGPGIGIYLFELAQRGYDVHGLDIVPENAELLRALAPHWAPQCTVDLGDATRINRAEGSIAGIYAMHVWEHVHDQVAALREAARILAPGGRLVVLDGNFFNPVHWKEYFVDRALARRDPLAGLRWLIKKRRVLEDFGMGWRGKDEDLKSVWWWRRELRRIPSLRPLTVTTTESFRRSIDGRRGLGPFEAFAGRIYVVAEKLRPERPTT